MKQTPVFKYRQAYKCQLCGEEFQGYCTNGVTDTSVMEALEHEEIRVHQCKDGSVGIGKLIGFRLNQ